MNPNHDSEPSSGGLDLAPEQLPDFRAQPGKLRVAVAVGSLVALVLYVVALLVDKSYGPALFATPFFIGLVSALLCPQMPYRSGLLGLLVALGVAVLTLREGVVCVLFSLPLLIPASLIGSWVGHVLVRFVRSERRRRGAVGGFLVLGVLWHVVEAAYDDRMQHPEHVAEAELFVASAPSFRIDRFEIEDLPFHITRLGQSPNYGFRPERVEDWLSVTSVRYSLRPAGNTGTWLSRRVVWRRHLFPDFYFGVLQRVVLERGQRRLLALLAEKMSPQHPAREGTGYPDARASHVCTAVHTPQLEFPGRGDRRGGTIAAVGSPEATNGSRALSWDASNTDVR